MTPSPERFTLASALAADDAAAMAGLVLTHRFCGHLSRMAALVFFDVLLGKPPSASDRKWLRTVAELLLIEDMRS